MNKYIVGFCLLFLTTSVSAQSLIAKVLRVGCHTVNGQCFVYLDKPIPEGSECTNTGAVLRWNSANVHNSEELYSTLLAAHATGTDVQFGSAGASCEGSYASFSWFSIQPK